MRKSFTAAVAFAAMFAIAIPSAAAPSGKTAPRQQSSVREREQSPVLVAVRKFLKKFGIGIQGLPGGPIPVDDENGEN